MLEQEKARLQTGPFLLLWLGGYTHGAYLEHRRAISLAMVIHQNFSDFVLFLYIHIALADGMLHEHEKKVILDKMKRLYPATSDHEERLGYEIRKYKDFDGRQLRTLFRDTLKAFSKVTFIQKYWVCIDLYDIIESIDKSDEAHTQCISALREMIDLSL